MSEKLDPPADALSCTDPRAGADVEGPSEPQYEEAAEDIRALFGGAGWAGILPILRKHFPTKGNR